MRVFVDLPAEPLTEPATMRAAVRSWRGEAVEGSHEALFLCAQWGERADEPGVDEWAYRRLVALRYPCRRELAGCFAARGQLKEALAVAEDGVDEGEHDCLALLGLMAEDRDELDVAERLWRQGAALGDPECSQHLARVLEDRGDTAALCAALRRAAQAGHCCSWSNLGCRLLSRNRAAALEALREARDAECVPGAFNLHVALTAGRARPTREERLEARAALRFAAMHGMVEAGINLAIETAIEDGCPEITATLRREAEAGNARCVTLLMRLYRMTGDDLRHNEMVRLLDPDHPERLLQEGIEAELAGHRPRARELWQRAVHFGSSDALVNLSAVALLDGEDDTAADLAAQAVKQRASGAEAALAAAIRDNNPDEAERLWRRALKHGDPDAGWHLALLLLDRDKPAAATRAARRALELDPKNRAAALTLGLLEAGEGRIAEAEDWFTRADRLGSGAAAGHLGGLRWGRGDLEGARWAYARAIRRGYGPAALEMAHLLDSDPAQSQSAVREAYQRALATGEARCAVGHLTGALPSQQLTAQLASGRFSMWKRWWWSVSHPGRDLVFAATMCACKTFEPSLATVLRGTSSPSPTHWDMHTDFAADVPLPGHHPWHDASAAAR